MNVMWLLLRLEFKCGCVRERLPISTNGGRMVDPRQRGQVSHHPACTALPLFNCLSPSRRAVEAVHGALNKLPTYIPIVHPVMFYSYGRGFFYCLTLDRRTAEVEIGPPNRLPETHLLFTLWVFYLYSFSLGKRRMWTLIMSPSCKLRQIQPSLTLERRAAEFDIGPPHRLPELLLCSPCGRFILQVVCYEEMEGLTFNFMSVV